MGITAGTRVIAGFHVNKNHSNDLHKFANWLMDSELAFSFERGDDKVIGMDISDLCQKPINGNMCSLYVLPPKLFTPENIQNLQEELVKLIKDNVKEYGEGEITIPEDFEKLISKGIQILTYVDVS